MRTALALAAVALCLPLQPALAVGSDSTDPPPPHVSRFAEAPTTVEFQLGLGAPTGLVGVGVEHLIAEVIALSGGVGLGVDGVQYAAGFRFQVPAESVTLGFGGSWSGGRIDTSSLFAEGAIWENASWINGEAHLIVRTDGGAQIRGVIGASVLTNPQDCISPGQDACPGEAVAEYSTPRGLIGVAFGQPF